MMAKSNRATIAGKIQQWLVVENISQDQNQDAVGLYCNAERLF